MLITFVCKDFFEIYDFYVLEYLGVTKISKNINIASLCTKITRVLNSLWGSEIKIQVGSGTKYL